MGLGLLVGSIPGPWITIAAPTALAFAFHDRRAAVRITALVLLVLSALLALAPPGGVAPLMLAAGGIGAATGWVARGRPGTLGAIAAPALAGAAVGWALAILLAPGALTAWETMLARGVTEGGEAALARYRSLGMSPDTLATFESVLETATRWTVRLWPALAALAVWLGAWLGGRFLARWGRIEPELSDRLSDRFTSFAVGEPVVWLLILALGGLWIPVEGVARAAANAGLVASVLFALDGLAVAVWWLERRRVSRVLVVVVTLIVVGLALPLTAGVLVAIGLSDPWIQYRDRPHRSGAAGRELR